MKTITLHPQNIHSGNLILVNQAYPIVTRQPEGTTHLIPVDAVHSDIFLEKQTATMLSQLIENLKCSNDIVPISGYRSLKNQQQIYVDSLADNGEAFTTKYVALPNHSEHQTGLAIDLAKKQNEIDFIRPFFPYSGICQVFREKAIRYGFVERYPKGKEGITGIAHEPWHFRYVGYPHSEIMKARDLTLEEYIETLKGFPYEGKHLRIKCQNQDFEIFYVEASAELQTTLELPDHTLYQISGNNSDGFIVTLWGEI